MVDKYSNPPPKKKHTIPQAPKSFSNMFPTNLKRRRLKWGVVCLEATPSIFLFRLLLNL